MHTTLRRIKNAYAKATGVHLLPLDKCAEVVADMVNDQDGIVIGHGHGGYAQIAFVEYMLPMFAMRGVRHLYVEMFKHWMQDAIDEWHFAGNAAPLVEIMNDCIRPYSRHMWKYNWSMLKTAKRQGIRVVAVEPNIWDIQKLEAYPGASMYVRNDAWSKRIWKYQRGIGQPYVLICGDDHLTRKGCNQWMPIQEMLGIPAVALKEGQSGMLPCPRNPRLSNLWLPRAASQTRIYKSYWDCIADGPFRPDLDDAEPCFTGNNSLSTLSIGL